MIQRRVRDYEVSLWSLQDSCIAILKQYGLEFKGQIQQPKLTDRDDGTQQFTFSVPMYLMKGDKRIENPAWYNIRNGALLINMRKIKVIFNKDKPDFKVYEFLITKVSQRHEAGELYCDIECEGLAFHELGKLGYKISLTAEDFYNDDYDWSSTGHWTDPYTGEPRTQQPLATLNYWNDKVFSTVNNWSYEINMNWEGYSLETYEKEGNLDDFVYENDVVLLKRKRSNNKVYEDDFVDSWKNDKDGNLIPAHITNAREKARVSININESNIYNITQTLAETFGVFCKYIYEYDENFHIINRKVVYYNNFINEQYGIIDINYPYNTSSITRHIDSTDLVTKLYVKSVENTASAAGLTSIIDVGANQSRQDYILNFDYLYKIGGITQQQYNSVNQYLAQMNKLNLLLAPISAKKISLQAQIPHLQSQLSTYKISIIKDLQQINNNKDLLNAVTKNTEILQVTEKNPQTAVLLKDTAVNYESYYIKLSQKGIYPETVHIYRSYQYSTSRLLNQITTGKIEFDEYGEVVKISNLFLDNSGNKTVYLIYDYTPSLYYERVQKMWEAKLAQDQAAQKELEQTLAKLYYTLYGTDNLPYPMDDINVAQLTENNISRSYRSLLQDKENLIKNFNESMGVAIREGFWQPEDYSDYGDKYTDTLKVGSQYIGQQNQFIGSTKNSSFYWDNELFDGEQKLYYEFGVDQQKIAYPCIDLRKNPQLLQFIQDNLDKNISIYFNTPVSTSISDAPRKSPICSIVPEKITIVPGLFNFSSNDVNDASIQLASATVETIYGGINSYDYSPFYGELTQVIGGQGYKKNYTYFKWQILFPDETEWENISEVIQDKTWTNASETNKYQFRILDKYKNNIRFTNENENSPQTIRILSGINNLSFNQCKIRLLVMNDLGSNLKIDGTTKESIWNKGTEPTLIEELPQPEIQILRLANYGLINQQRIQDTIFKCRFTINEDNYSTNKYILQYYRSTSDNITEQSWKSKTEVIDNWITLIDENGVVQENNDFNNIIDTSDHTLNYNKDINVLNLLDNTEIRFRLVVKNITSYATNSMAISPIYRVFSATTKPWITDVIQNTNNSQEIQICVQYSSAAILYEDSRYSNYKIDDVQWYKSQVGINDNNPILINPNGNTIIVENSRFEEQSDNFTKIKIKTSNWPIYNDSWPTTFISNWDGYYIFPKIINKSNEIVIPTGLDKNNICSAIRINQDTNLPTKCTGYLQENEITIPIGAIQISRISSANWNIVHQDITRQISLDNLLISNSSNEWQQQSGTHYYYRYNKQDNKYIAQLELRLPSIKDIADNDIIALLGYSNDQIYLTAKNPTDDFSFNPQHEISYFKSQTCTLDINLPVELQCDEATILSQTPSSAIISSDWWPILAADNNNQSFITDFPIKFNIYLKNLDDVTLNFNNGYISDFLYKNNGALDMDINNINFSSISWPNYDNNAFNLQREGRISDTQSDIILDFNLTAKNWNNFIYDNNVFVGNNLQENDNKYYFVIKIELEYTLSNILTKSYTIYYYVNIRQCAPLLGNSDYMNPNNDFSFYMDGIDGYTYTDDGVVYGGVRTGGKPLIVTTRCFKPIKKSITTSQWRLHMYNYYASDGESNDAIHTRFQDGEYARSDNDIRAENNFLNGRTYTTYNAKWTKDTIHKLILTTKDYNSLEKYDKIDNVLVIRQLKDDGKLLNSTSNHVGLYRMLFTTSLMDKISGGQAPLYGYESNLHVQFSNPWGTTITCKWGPCG